MTELEKKINLTCKMHEEMAELQRQIVIKQNLLGDIMKEMTVELGFDKDAKEVPMFELLSRVFQKAKK